MLPILDRLRRSRSIDGQRSVKPDTPRAQSNSASVNPPIPNPMFDNRLLRRLPAGQAVLMLAIILAVNLVFNSAGVLHQALGMSPGPLRTVAVTVLHPIDTVAHTLWLDRPKQWLDGLFGHELDATGGAGLANGNDDILNGPLHESGRPGLPVMDPPIVNPTPSDPLRLLVMGDSLSANIGQHLDQRAAEHGLVRVKQVVNAGTGITTPEFFNWLAAAEHEVSRFGAQSLVMAVGANDVNGMSHNGEYLTPGTAEWEREYARRVAVISQAAIDRGTQRVFWVGPPVSDSSARTDTYRLINNAIRTAADAVPGLVYVDVFRDANGNELYGREVTVNGRSVPARQSDGTHWTFDGAAAPAAEVSEAIDEVYGEVL